MFFLLLLLSALFFVVSSSLASTSSSHHQHHHCYNCIIIYNKTKIQLVITRYSEAFGGGPWPECPPGWPEWPWCPPSPPGPDNDPPIGETLLMLPRLPSPPAKPMVLLLPPPRPPTPPIDPPTGPIAPDIPPPAPLPRPVGDDTATFVIVEDRPVRPGRAFETLEGPGGPGAVDCWSDCSFRAADFSCAASIRAT